VRTPDFFFKLYFSFFRKRDRRGAAAAAILVSIPLSFNVWLVLLFLISFAVPIREIGNFFFAIPLATIGLIIGLCYRRVYVIQERYKLIKYDSVFLYYVIAFMHYTFSVIVFIIGGFVLYSNG